jgi:hypothetical protein
MARNVLKEFVKKTRQRRAEARGGIAAYSKTAKLLIKLTYTVKSYLMDYGWRVHGAWVGFIVKFFAMPRNAPVSCSAA